MKGWRAGAGAEWDGGTVDLGNEPPLSVEDKLDDTPIRRAVSLRWLSGTVLTGLTSAFLMGGALMTALDGRHQLAVAPEANAAVASSGPAETKGGKGDRIRPLEQAVSSRQLVQVSTITREADRDLIRLRPFARVSATLATASNDFTADVPDYDPLRIFAAGTVEEAAPVAAEAAGQIYDADVDGEVAIKVSDFPLDAAEFDAADAFRLAEVQEIVMGSLESGREGAQVAALAYSDAGTVIDGEEDPFSALGVSIVPENVTLITKTSSADDPARDFNEKIVVLGEKETFRELLARNDIGEDDTTDITAALGRLIDLDGLKPGQKVRIAYAPTDVDGGTFRPMRVSLYDNDAHRATIARSDAETFIEAEEPASLPEAFVDAESEKGGFGPMPRLYEAVYQTALEQKIPKRLIDDLIKIFSYEVDYQTHVTPGDAIEVFHSLPDPDSFEQLEDEILYASISLGGTTKRFYRYQTPDDGVIDYYDAEGKSAKKFLMRKPMTSGIFRSGFGNRKHPILGYRKMHTGVDWAAPRGTPIMAAGDGIVEKAGRTSGYGNFTMIRHTNGYETAYGHQTSFAKGIKPGVTVRQGQIIGYVGSTGLSTGPHLHYEVRINGKLVDPLRIRLPRGRVLQGELLEQFTRERERIDALLGHSPASRVASAD